MSNKPFREMTDDELIAEYAHWDEKVATATGWGASLMQAAKWRDATGELLYERGLLPDFTPGDQAVAMSEAERVLRAALLWATNHIDSGVRPELKAEILSRLDRVLADHRPMVADIELLRERYP